MKTGIFLGTEETFEEMYRHAPVGPASLDQSAEEAKGQATLLILGSWFLLFAIPLNWVATDGFIKTETAVAIAVGTLLVALFFKLAVDLYIEAAIEVSYYHDSFCESWIAVAPTGIGNPGFKFFAETAPEACRRLISSLGPGYRDKRFRRLQIEMPTNPTVDPSARPAPIAA